MSFPACPTVRSVLRLLIPVSCAHSPGFVESFHWRPASVGSQAPTPSLETSPARSSTSIVSVVHTRLPLISTRVLPPERYAFQPRLIQVITARCDLVSFINSFPNGKTSSRPGGHFPACPQRILPRYARARAAAGSGD